jgi:zinc/manganese transport system substrate-binding protein
MMFRRTLITAAAAFAALGATALPASAKVDVVAVDQTLAWVVSDIGGKNVSVDYFAGSNQDPHTVEPRPSQVAKLQNADMLVRIGLDLDLWLDSLIRAAGNGKVAVGGKGYVDASKGIRPLEVPSGKLDPSKGDLHVYGNPHYIFGPSNLRVAARNVADGLKRVDPANASTYEANFKGMMDQLQSSMATWKAKLGPDRKKQVVTYHKSLIYFLAEFGIIEAGNVETKPGLEPTAGHIAEVAKDMKAEGVKAILMESYRSRRFADLLARQSGGTVVTVPAGVGAEKGLNDYFSFMSAIVDRVSAAL